MSTFVRNQSVAWHAAVPGARWFRADLHVHTLDDHPSANFRWPAGLSGRADDLDVQTAYARRLLQAAAKNRIEVIGLTPHAVRSGATDTTSATWRVVEVWNHDSDDDGIPFRDKIYAVFPGFELNCREGSSGLHLQFLFDPEIGRESLLSAFNEAMGGLPAYSRSSLQISSKRADECFEALRSLQERLSMSWEFLCLAPHAFGDRGLFSSLKAQVLSLFPHRELCGIELKDNWLPEDAFADKPWLENELRCHRHALFHASDAYEVTDIGKRFTLMKLASPRIRSLQQCFLAADSRIRIAYRRTGGQLQVDSDLPDPLPGRRPWLRSVTVTGGTSFFGGLEPDSGAPQSQTFNFNPDLTCIIGGRMSGKSTLLDGLRVWFEHPLPNEDRVREDVLDRAQTRFLSGDPRVTTEIRGPENPAAPPRERWPAQFFTQRELQTAVHDQETRRQLLYRLVATDAATLVRLDAELAELDEELLQLVAVVTSARERVEEADEELRRVARSREALERIASAGVELLTTSQTERARIEQVASAIGALEVGLERLIPQADAFDLSGLSSEALQELLSGDDEVADFPTLARGVGESLQHSVELLKSMRDRLEPVTEEAERLVAAQHARIQHALIEAGGSAEELNQFDALAETAATFDYTLAEYRAARRSYREALRTFAAARRRRGELLQNQASAMESVISTVETRFSGRIRLRREAIGDTRALEEWIVSLREKGLTRWWNNHKSNAELRLSPEIIRRAHRTNDCSSIGMSGMVAETFSGLMGPSRRIELAARRNEECYSIELRVDGQFRPIDELSGGAQVSVLLSLVLETDDSSPLVIDQPEDEMDKSYLFDVLLPALRRLKGRKQIVFVTHDANIVVNGDADQVIFLQADSEHGRVEEEGAIEQDEVRDAIVLTLDGGRDAFALRQAKYNF